MLRREDRWSCIRIGWQHSSLPVSLNTGTLCELDKKNEYDQLMKEDESFARAIAGRASKNADGDDPIVPMLAATRKATQDQKRLGSVASWGVGLSVAGIVDEKNDPMEKIILNFRNRALARFVAQSLAEKSTLLWCSRLSAVLEGLASP